MVPGKKIFYKLEKIYSPIEWELSEVRKNLNSLKNNFKEACYSITDYTLSSEGKLLRPALLIFFFYLTKKGKFRHTSEKISDLIKLATGIELLHLASLVHDDIIDESKLRRGKPTCQHLWGKDFAVITGDLLLTLAWEILSFYPFVVDYAIKVAKNMCESKIIELSLNFCPDLATYLDLVAKKTGLLFSLSCYIGSKLAQGDESIAKNFGLNFGLAYQIIDDCLDFISKEEKIGKDTNVDSRLNRNSNLILLYLKKEKLSLEDSIQKAYELAKEKLDCAYSYLSSFQASAYKDKLETLGDYILNMLNR